MTRTLTLGLMTAAFSFALDGAADVVQFRQFNDKIQGGVYGTTHPTQGLTPGSVRAGEMFRGRIMADGRYVKVYMNDTRVANIPQRRAGAVQQDLNRVCRPGRRSDIHRQHQRHGGRQETL